MWGSPRRRFDGRVWLWVKDWRQISTSASACFADRARGVAVLAEFGLHGVEGGHDDLARLFVQPPVHPHPPRQRGGMEAVLGVLVAIVPGAAVPIDRIHREPSPSSASSAGCNRRAAVAEEYPVYLLELVGPFRVNAPAITCACWREIRPAENAANVAGKISNRADCTVARAAPCVSRHFSRSVAAAVRYPSVCHSRDRLILPDPDQPLGLEPIQLVRSRRGHPTGREHRNRSNHASDNTEGVRHPPPRKPRKTKKKMRPGPARRGA